MESAVEGERVTSEARAGERRSPPQTVPWWVPALSLVERLPAPDADGTDPADEAAARLGRWRDAHPDLADDTLALLARGIGADVADIGRVLAEEPEALARRVAQPAWAVSAEAAVAGLSDRWAVSPPGDTGERPSWQAGFAAVVRPLSDLAVTAVEGSEPFREAAPWLEPGRVLDALRSHVTTRLVAVAARTLVLELHRMRVSGRLSGENGESRFRSFVETMCTAQALTRLLGEYPVLTRTLVTVSGQAAEVFAEFLRRFASDREELVRVMFGGVDPGLLTGLEFAAGDLHDGGRGVLLMRFASGRRLVYKPRPMAVHTHVNDVLAWFGERLPAAAPRLLGVLDRGPYGWVEFVAPAPCADSAGAQRFFFRLGAHLAVLYVLAGTDFHYENMIAVGDQPVLVDLESVLHVGLPMLSGSAFVDDDPAAGMLERSVSRVGLLPSVLAGTGRGAIDVGGLGGDAGAVTPFPEVDWADPGTDRMRLTRVRRSSQGSQNKVILDGKPAEPERYTDQVRAGFKAGYAAVLRHRDELAGPDGLLARFAHDDIRVITRATRTYSRLLDETTHPDVLRDALERDRVLSMLWALADGDGPRLALAGHELRDMWEANIPLLRTSASSRDVRTTGGAVLPRLLAESGLARAQGILAQMGEEDLARQDWIVRASMATRARELARTRPPATPSPRPAVRGTKPADRALAGARDVAARLETSAIHADGRVCWFGLDLLAGDQWQVTTLDGGLFNGYAGIGLYFAQLAHVLDDAHAADLAHRILTPLAVHVGLVSDAGSRRIRLGAFGGECGVAYALASASLLLAAPGLAAPVGDLLRRAAGGIETDTALDVMSGAAGCLAVAEALVPRFGAAAAELAERSAAFLVSRAVPAGGGTAWSSSLECSQPLLGFSHGAAGIGWALLRYADRTGDTACREAGHAAFAYERGQFRRDVGNWPDFRSGNSRPWGTQPQSGGVTHMHSWCHGAPGIGLTRAALPERTRTPDTEGDLRLAVESTTRFGLYGNHSLCHGDLGNLELFSAAAGLGIPGSAEERDRRVGALLDQIDAYGPLCGTPGALTSPGLMTGLAGIGHGLLRIAAPERVASVLLLENLL